VDSELSEKILPPPPKEFRLEDEDKMLLQNAGIHAPDYMS
jgi:hypothetical protein